MKPIDLNAGAREDAFRWGIIGFGHVAVIHAWGIKEMGHRLKGFTTSNKKVQSGDATDLVFNIGDIAGPLFDASEMNVPERNYYALLEDESIDGVIICAPTDAHMELAMATARANKHCFLEKPMASSWSDAADILDAFSDSKGKLVVGHVLPSFPEFSLLRQEIMQRGIQQVQYLEMHRWVAETRTDDEADTVGRGGFAADLGIHDFNLLLGLGKPSSVRTVEAEMRYDQYQRVRSIVTLEESAGTFVCDVGACGEDGFHHSYELRFSDGGTLAFDGTTIFRDGVSVAMQPKSVPRIFGDELEIAARYFRGEGDASFLSANTALDTLKILEAAAESAKSNTAVSL